MKLIGIKFILKSGNFLQVVMKEYEADTLIKDWTERNPRLLDRVIIGATAPSPGSGKWAVVIADVSAMHTVEMQTETYQQPYQAPNALGSPVVSGLIVR